MELNTLKDLFIHELRDLYSAEKQLIKALPKMAKAANNTQLKDGFKMHLEETKVHAQRLEDLLQKLGKTTRGEKCKGMAGLIEEGEGLIEDDPDPDVLDAGLIAAAQRVEHYEMAGYGCARTYAKVLGDREAQRVLQTTLDEEGATDKKLTKLAENSINLRAVSQ